MMGKITKDYAALRLLIALKNGKLVWKERPGNTRFNTRYAGKEVFAATSNQGYHRLHCGKTGYQYHIVLWMLHFGEVPTAEIDHINGNPADNRIENLREVTRSMNSRNMALRIDNTTGAVGVCRKGSRWASTICTNGDRQWLGTFPTRELAIAARMAVHADLGFTARHGSRS